MYGLSKTENLQAIVGATLTQVCVGENEILLNFDKPVAVTILSEFTVTNSGVRVHCDDPRTGASLLFGYIGSSVESVSATDAGGLLMEFAPGTLEVLDASDDFESIWIKIGDRQIIV